MGTRHFELKLSYRSDAGNFNVDAVDVVTADSLVSLLSQFNIVIASLHHRILEEEKSKQREVDDDVPF